MSRREGAALLVGERPCPAPAYAGGLPNDRFGRQARLTRPQGERARRGGVGKVACPERWPCKGDFHGGVLRHCLHGHDISRMTWLYTLTKEICI